jgi:flavodoxin
MVLKTLVVYESKYGSTELVARKLGLVLGPSRCIRVGEFKEQDQEFDLFVIGTPVTDCRIPT